MGIFNKIKQFFAPEVKNFQGSGSFSLGDFIIGNNSQYKTYTHLQLLELYKGWVFACCDTIGDGLSMLNTSLYKNETQIDKIDNPYSKLLDTKMMKAISVYLKTVGDVYIYKVKIGNKVTELLLLKSWNIIENVNSVGTVLNYEYFDGYNYYKFDPKELIVIKTFSPLFTQSGMTPLKAVANQVAMDYSSIEFNRLFFENGGKPGTVLKSSSKIDENIRDKYLQKWKDNFVGLKNSNKVAFLDQGIELQDFSSTQKDMDLTNQRQFTMDEVLMIFRVPKPLMGKSDGVGFADKNVPGYYFTEYCLKPLGELIKDELNSQLYQGLGYFTFEFPQDKDFLLKEYQANLISQNQYLRLTGRPENESGDRLWDGTEVTERKELVKQTRLEKALFEAVNKGISLKEFGTEEYNQKVWETKISRTDKYEVEMAKIQKKVFNIQETEIIKNLDTKDFKLIKNEGDLFDEKQSRMLYLTLYTKFFQDMMGKEGQIAIEEISDEMFAIAKINKWIGENIDRMSKDIDETTRKEMFEIIKQGNRDGEGPGQIATAIRSQFNQYTKKNGRIEKIVRSEITRSSNKSQDEAYKQSGVVAYKEWFTASDERVCPYCGDLNKKRIGLDKDFLKLGDKHVGQEIAYENISYPPRHVSCRCTIRPIIERKSFDNVNGVLKRQNKNLLINNTANG